MNQMGILFLWVLCYSISFAKAESVLPLMEIDPHIQIQYETCTCINNSYTQQLVKPYLSEIETWLFQTQEEITDSSLPFICPHCEEEETEVNTGLIDSIKSTFNRWYEQAQDKMIFLFSDDEEPHPSQKIIHPLCFQMGHKFINGQGSNKQFLSCIHDHYDGSEDGLCRAVSDQPFASKQCMAIPISCKDVNNTHLTCSDELKYRPDDFKQLDGCNKGAAYPTRPCFSQLYTAMTMKAFYDVSQCLGVDENLAFAILFHESRFVINIKSYTGALCYGQVTGDAVTDVNLLLEGRLYSDLQPFVEPNLCPQAWEHFRKIETTKSVTRYVFSSAQDQCHLNLNPYTCFFYAMGYLKILNYYVEKAISKTNKAWRVWRDNQWFVLWDLPEATTETDVSEMEEINIFKDTQTLTRILVILSYNGGPSINNYFEQYMQSLKKNIETNAELKQNFLENGLSLDFFRDHFMEFLKHNYQPMKRRTEVTQFLDKTIKDVSELNQLIAIQHPELPQNICPHPLSINK